MTDPSYGAGLRSAAFAHLDRLLARSPGRGTAVRGHNAFIHQGADLRIEVQQRVLDEIDGPMLRHGLQDIAGVRLSLPRAREAQPDPDRLAERYEMFRAAS